MSVPLHPLQTVPIAAGVVGDLPLAAVLASLDVTAEGSSAAVLDRRHDLQLSAVEGLGEEEPSRRHDAVHRRNWNVVLLLLDLEPAEVVGGRCAPISHYRK
ncbi:hypothetical protein QO002_004229 [Pararhizobium capsulatum DSM 1112]|uniref:Uncharacterized protein n=1 Tax=Pararhizobium capsulatum DSM 1112 TaxID=1121113 RepID=A0ABU0BUU0_9HYPH|nr:hypothetical protein [Pararhizobium capsulatum DSM 1112]